MSQRWALTPEGKDYHRDYSRRYQQSKTGKQARAMAARRIKLACLAAYSDGQMVCAKCGYSNVDALTLDHINNDGKAHRARVGGGYNVYWDLKRRDFPLGFQVLCMNCNGLKEVERRRRDGRAVRVVGTLP